MAGLGYFGIKKTVVEGAIYGAENLVAKKMFISSYLSGLIGGLVSQLGALGVTEAMMQQQWGGEPGVLNSITSPYGIVLADDTSLYTLLSTYGTTLEAVFGMSGTAELAASLCERGARPPWQRAP